ncbi:conserved protein of unknown function [Petrocella atlantisensis]|uniref:Uracil-DNA glycosylase-like domain-containing protein n=1 Tax=Petrocella atlantisensis TaxID=2173034 RepID=A0A3P7NY48_9FIRM|nr:uracil-DNA glycosylase family protein [Petrocella atlantisensis]VDN47895.1 conserved protein of unknown function [Petrocella atlantisensis]
MINEIMNCNKCNMCNNQRPLLDKVEKCDVMWVGLSAKQVDNVLDEVPLSVATKSGKLINEMESEVQGCKFYKTNVVKCLPLNNNGKLRYPTKKEMDLCIVNLKKEIELLKPKIIILLGNNVIQSVEKSMKVTFDKFNDYEYKLYKYGEFSFLPIHHPSYISVYKRKSKEIYIDSVKELIMLSL